MKLVAAFVALLLSSSARASEAEVRVEFDLVHTEAPDHVCVVTELQRPDVLRSKCKLQKPSVAPADDACLISDVCPDTSLFLRCLQGARVPEDERPTRWAFDGKLLDFESPIFANRKDLKAAMGALVSFQPGTTCADAPERCRPAFDLPPSLATKVFQDGAGTHTETYPLNVACFQQAGSVLRKNPRVAVVLVDFANPIKQALNSAKLVGNLMTMTFSEDINERAGVSASLVGGHFADSPSSFVIDGMVTLPLRERCSSHAVKIGRHSAISGSLQATLRTATADGIEENHCHGSIAHGVFPLWLSHDEELWPTSLTLERREHDNNIQSYGAEWSNIDPAETLNVELRKIFFEFEGGCFIPKDECPTVWLEDLVQCQRVSEVECQYTCDAGAHNAAIALPANLTLSVGATSDYGERSESHRYRWHQRLPAAGATLVENIQDPAGRSVTFDLSRWMSHNVVNGFRVAEVTLRSRDNTLVIKNPSERAPQHDCPIDHVCAEATDAEERLACLVVGSCRDECGAEPSSYYESCLSRCARERLPLKRCARACGDDGPCTRTCWRAHLRAHTGIRTLAADVAALAGARPTYELEQIFERARERAFKELRRCAQGHQVRIAAPGAYCGERYEVIVEASHYVPTTEAEIAAGGTIIADPRPFPGSGVFSLAATHTFADDNDDFGEGGALRARVNFQSYPFMAQGYPFYAGLGLGGGAGAQSAILARAGQETRETLSWGAFAFYIITGWAPAIAGPVTASLETSLGLGFTTLSREQFNTSDLLYFTMSLEQRAGLRFGNLGLRYLSLDGVLGFDFFDPTRRLESDTGKVTFDLRARPYAGVAISAHFP